MFPLSVQAAPFLEADVVPEADTCTVSGLPTAIPATVQEANSKCRWDLNGLPVGQYTVTATASNVWGTSANSVPFAFERSASTNAPAGLRLVP